MTKHFFILSLCLLVYLEVREIEGNIDLAYEIYFPSSEIKEDLPPIVLLHAFLDWKSTWKYVAQPLADKTGRIVYTYDARNHGDSPWTPDFSLDILTEDLKDFLAARNVSEVILVGHNMGGRTAETFALNEPDKVEMLVVEDAGIAVMSKANAIFSSFIMRLLQKALTVIPPDADEETALESVKGFIRKSVPGGFLPRRETDDELLPMNVHGSNITWKANMDVLSEKLHEGALFNNVTGTYEKDALYIYGTKSPARVDRDELIQEYFPRAQLLGFVGGNHLIHYEYAEDYVREVARFITGVITPGSEC